MDSEIVDRIAIARDIFFNAPIGSEEFDFAWKELSAAIDSMQSYKKSAVSVPVTSFRDELVKAIAPVVLANLYDSAKYSDNEVAVYAKMRTDEIVNSLMED
ncbi:MAG: hypothetical protein ACRC62_39485 [Microcoleus sp.]